MFPRSCFGLYSYTCPMIAAFRLHSPERSERSKVRDYRVCKEVKMKWVFCGRIIKSPSV